MATFDPNGSYSSISTTSGIYYLQGGHYFTSKAPFVDQGTIQPSLPPVPFVDQSPAAVSITGGAIDGAVIGATTPAAATFTTVTATTITGNVSGSATPSGPAAGDLSGTYPNPTVAKVTSTLSSYNGVVTVGNGIAPEVAQVNLVNQGANVSSATLYAVPSTGAGMYRATCYAVETTADGASSTLPSIGIGWTDSDSSVALLATTVTPTNTANAAGAFGSGSQVFYAKASTNVTYQTSSYASGTAGAMKYAVRIKLEYLG